MQYVYDIMRKSALYLQHLPHIPVSFTLQPDHLASSDLLHHLRSYITRNKGMTIFQMSLLPSTFWAVFMDGNGKLMCFIRLRDLKWEFWRRGGFCNCGLRLII